MVITTTSTKIIPNAIYTKNAGKIFSNKHIVNARIAIIDIPIPIVLHNFFSSYFSFSSFEAVLYPEMNQLPCPESKIIESTENIAKTILYTGKILMDYRFLIFFIICLCTSHASIMIFFSKSFSLLS